MKITLQSFVVITLAIYPIIVYLGLTMFTVKTISLFMMVMFILRLLVSSRYRDNFPQQKVLRRIIIPGALCGIALSILSLIMNSDHALFFYPVLISATGLLVFSWSLWHPPSIIECFARMLDRDFPGNKPDKAISYTNAITAIWCFFLSLMPQ